MAPSPDTRPRARPGTSYFDQQGVASVAWDSGHAIVVVEWDGWANSHEFESLLEAEIRALTEHHAKGLLIDCRRQRPLLPADLERADIEWLPRAVKAGLTRFAVVLPTSELAALDLLNRQASFERSSVHVQYFATPEEARHWLAT